MFKLAFPIGISRRLALTVPTIDVPLFANFSAKTIFVKKIVTTNIVTFTEIWRHEIQYNVRAETPHGCHQRHSKD